MFRQFTAVSLLTLLTACGDGQPFSFGNIDEPTPEPGGEEEEPTPAEATQGNLTDSTYAPGPERLTVYIESLDSTPQYVTYDRNEALDVGPYQAYSVQEDPLDRMFIGLARRVPNGVVEGVLVMDGGQFNRYFGGTNVRQLGPYSPHTPSQPENGLVSYAGRYVGMLNIDAPRPNEAQPVPAGTPDAFIPGQAARVRGDILINADFTDNTVNGAVANRVIIDLGTEIADINLIVADIEEDGSFGGIVETEVDTNVGDYSGVFGGVGATGVAGGVFLDGDFIEGVDGENEYGLFVLAQCGERGDAALCDDVNPN